MNNKALSRPSKLLISCFFQQLKVDELNKKGTCLESLLSFFSMVVYLMVTTKSMLYSTLSKDINDIHSKELPILWLPPSASTSLWKELQLNTATSNSQGKQKLV